MENKIKEFNNWKLSIIVIINQSLSLQKLGFYIKKVIMMKI